MSDQSVNVRISGRVQGVGFRWWTRDQAGRLGLRGWVRNRRDGSVEAVFIGPAATVEEMVALCHEGPPAARVETVVTQPWDGLGVTDFRSKPTL